MGKICGIRTRHPDGHKRAITGSRAGIFIPGVYDANREIVICEGPTDAAAAMALGFEPIGRPSCIGSERHVVDTCRRRGINRVTLCADADGPGISGAKKLGEVLLAVRITVRMVTAGGHKDLRDWFKAGVTRAMVDAAWSQAEWRG
jgi:DNA primase